MNAVGVAGLGLLVLFAGAPQIYRVAVDGVRVDVLVSDGKRSVRGLTAADFELRDRGVVQTIDSVSFEDVPLSVMLVLDTSSSVRGIPLTHLKQAASARRRSPVAARSRRPDDVQRRCLPGLRLDERPPPSSHRDRRVDAGGATALYDVASRGPDAT